MSKLSSDYGESVYAIIKLSTKEEVTRLQNLLVSEGFTNVSYVKNLPENVLTSAVDVDEIINISDSTNDVVVVSKRKATGGRKRLLREKCTNNSHEGVVTPNNADVESSISANNNLNLTATVIAALSNITNNEKKCGGGEQPPQQPSSSSPTNSNSNGLPSSENTTTLPSPIPFVARPRGSRMQVSDDPTIYASCNLCSNKIMSSRLSNLTNHVRRHAALKQYQCCHCAYSHNEMAKVRLHMQHNHSDYDSSPIDAMCKEMQQQWANLMEQCFPGHAKRFAHNNSFIAALNDDITTPTQVKTEITPERIKSTPTPLPAENEPQQILEADEAEEDEEEDGKFEEAAVNKFDIKELYRPVSPSEIFCCSHCGEYVQSAKLMTHLVEIHPNICHSFTCSECEFLANAPWKVTLHIYNEHNGDGVTVMTPTGINFVVCVPLFFPDFAKRRGYTLEDEMLRHDFVKTFSIQLNRDLNSLKAIQCEFCFKLFTADQNISVLLDHATIHFGIKNYSCPECKYHSSEISIVYSHIEKRHPHITQKLPIDSSISENIQSWHKLACLCFPTLSDTFTDMVATNKNNKSRGGKRRAGGISYLEEKSRKKQPHQQQLRNSSTNV